MKQLNLETAGPDGTHQVGARLGRLLRPGDAVLLSGELGTGKTVLTQGIAEGLDVREPVKSPSFVLLHEYEGRFPVYHADLYRLESPQEVADLGLDEVAADGVLVVEWAERGNGVLPEEHLRVRLAYAGGDRRRLTLDARGGRYEELLDRLAEAVPQRTGVA
jgi:tRNA threonylcarbamoyladenosine biosynthesis protein TsaE